MKTREEVIESLGLSDENKLSCDCQETIDAIGTEVYIKQNKSKWFVLYYFKGKGLKPKTPVQMPTYELAYNKGMELIRGDVKEYTDKQSRKNARKNQRQEYVKNVKEGDVLYSTWGYDQTNVHFYQVTRKDKSKFFVREVKQDKEYNPNGNSGLTKPLTDQFIGEEFKVGVNGYGFTIGEHTVAKPLGYTLVVDGKRVYDTLNFSENR